MGGELKGELISILVYIYIYIYIYIHVLKYIYQLYQNQCLKWWFFKTMTWQKILEFLHKRDCKDVKVLEIHVFNVIRAYNNGNQTIFMVAT